MLVVAFIGTAAVALIYVLSPRDEAIARRLMEAYRSALVIYDRDAAALHRAREDVINAGFRNKYTLKLIQKLREDPTSVENVEIEVFEIDVDNLDEQKQRLERQLEELPQAKAHDEAKERKSLSEQRLLAAEDELMASTAVLPSDKYQIAQEMRTSATDRLDELKRLNAEHRRQVVDVVRRDFLGKELAKLDERMFDPEAEAQHDATRETLREIREQIAKLEGRPISEVLDEEEELLQKERDLLNRWKARVDEFNRLATTEGSDVYSTLDAEYDKLWTEHAILEVQATLERASRFLNQAQAEMKP